MIQTVIGLYREWHTIKTPMLQLECTCPRLNFQSYFKELQRVSLLMLKCLRGKNCTPTSLCKKAFEANPFVKSPTTYNIIFHIVCKVAKTPQLKQQHVN